MLQKCRCTHHSMYTHPARICNHPTYVYMCAALKPTTHVSMYAVALHICESVNQRLRYKLAWFFNSIELLHSVYY